ncbi:MAG: FHA domain-containing protein [Anaerolineaceae bacterium]|nr:FHA domain-containing protein [Anaerolineaceae bacterium]
MMSSNYQLVMKNGPNPGQIFVLDGTEFSIGRDINNDFVINDTEMSRKHAKIYVYGQGFVIEDLGSTNGTFVNGQRLTSIHQLVAGETVSFGETVNLTFEVPTFDPDATRVSVQPLSYAQPVVAPPVPQETFISAPPPQQYQSAPVHSSYAGEVPGTYPASEKPKKKSRVFLIVIILFFLIICGCIVFWLVIDSLNLYCDLFPGIMNAIFGSGSCP